MTALHRGLRVLRGLALGCHPEPTVAVTTVATALAVALGRGFAGTLAVAAAVLMGQLSVGWQNDYLDRHRDVTAGRTDKPVAAQAVAPRTVAVAFWIAAVAVLPLSLLSGVGPGLLHLMAVVSAWSYNLWLKSTVFSVLPYVVSFGLLPAFVVTGGSGSATVPGWLVLAGALMGSGAHFANVLPDIADDLRNGVRGLPHRIGATASRCCAAGLLVAATVVIAVGGGSGWFGAAVALVAVATGAEGLRRGRIPGSRAAFLSILTVAVVDVALLLLAGRDLT